MSYMRIDEKNNIIDSFEKARDFLLTQKNLLDLKWFVLAFHHGVHNLMLLALVDSAQGGIWVEDKKRGLPIMRDLGGGTYIVDTFNEKNKLLGFMVAFKYIQDYHRMHHFVMSKPFVAQPYHRDSMMHLNDRLRNQFIHYRPLGWSINEQYIYEICKPVIEIANFLVFQSGQCNFDLDEQNKLREIFKSMDDFFILKGVK